MLKKIFFLSFLFLLISSTLGFPGKNNKDFLPAAKNISTIIDGFIHGAQTQQTIKETANLLNPYGVNAVELLFDEIFVLSSYEEETPQTRMDLLISTYLFKIVALIGERNKEDILPIILKNYFKGLDQAQRPVQKGCELVLSELYNESEVVDLLLPYTNKQSTQKAASDFLTKIVQGVARNRDLSKIYSVIGVLTAEKNKSFIRNDPNLRILLDSLEDVLKTPTYP